MQRLVIIGLGLMLFVLFPFSLSSSGRGDFDKKTQSSGLENFTITEIFLKGQTEWLRLIDLNDDGFKELLYIHRAEINGSAQLVLEILDYAQKDKQYHSTHPAFRIPDGTAIISIGNYLPSKGKEIVLYQQKGVSCYESELGDDLVPFRTPTLLVKVGEGEEVIFFPSGQYSPSPFFQEAIDINNDGIDDLVIPTKSGYLLCWGPYQNGVPARKQVISCPAKESIEAGKSSFISIAYSLPHIALVDLNGDILRDVVLGFNNSTNPDPSDPD
ncbi:MAG: hypothetical protein QME51_00695, partial [Planctomycetota bacterium]|nr:hypothetical protein [Planctomycetota bacterium]